MSDIIDDAQAAEALHRQAALSRAQPWRGPAPTIIDGEAFCADCGELIPLERQLAVPGVGLCVECQDKAEVKHGRR